MHDSRQRALDTTALGIASGTMKVANYSARKRCRGGIHPATLPRATESSLLRLLGSARLGRSYACVPVPGAASNHRGTDTR